MHVSYRACLLEVNDSIHWSRTGAGGCRFAPLSQKKLASPFGRKLPIICTVFDRLLPVKLMIIFRSSTRFQTVLVNFGCGSWIQPVVALCDLPTPDRTLALAYPQHVRHRCGKTVVMRRWMTGRTSSQTGVWQRKRRPTLRSISESIGEWLRRRFWLAAGQACARRTRRSAIGSADGAFSW